MRLGREEKDSLLSSKVVNGLTNGILIIPIACRIFMRNVGLGRKRLDFRVHSSTNLGKVKRVSIAD